MKIVVSPNPYRDKQFKHARQACQILKEAGAEVSLCLPFDVDRSFEIPSDLRFREIQKEIRTADMLICFGGDGTILHSSKIATRHLTPTRASAAEASAVSEVSEILAASAIYSATSSASAAAGEKIPTLRVRAIICAQT